MNLSYGQNASMFGHADYYGNKASGRSMQEIYDYVNRNQFSLAERNRYGGADGLSDLIARDYQTYQAQERQRQEEAQRKQKIEAERASQEAQRRAQEESQRKIMEERGNLEVKQPNAESYIKLNFERPSYERDSGSVDANQSTSPINPFESDIYSASKKYTDSRSRYRVPRNQDSSSSSYGLDLRRNAKEKSSNWMKIQKRRDERAGSRASYASSEEQKSGY